MNQRALEIVRLTEGNSVVVKLQRLIGGAVLITDKANIIQMHVPETPALRLLFVYDTVHATAHVEGVTLVVDRILPEGEQW
jgi:hypothetical protein